ncbi:hypothetical protein BJX61DRAFT_533460 [Aspergillus egyptiacus]|nr:hypothetical protein BJX61DRAFT_533460 [Aspergillus egyptiacus]
MDFLTIPFISVFVLPTLSSYSTRINVLFFYMTWTTLVLAHDALRVELFGTLAARLVFYVLPSLLFYIFDSAAPGTAVIFKERGEAGLPSGNKRRSPSLSDLRIAAWSIANLALSIAVQIGLEALLMKTPRLRPAVKTTIRVPMPWIIAKDVLLGFLVREVLVYTIHRTIIHSSQPLLRPITTLHRKWHHSLRAPFPLTAHYDHPLTYLIVVFIPMYVPVFLFHFHMTTFLVYTVLISIEETFTFSGYYILPSMLGGIARRMELHLANGGKSYFGRWGFIDLIAGSGRYIDDNERAQMRQRLANLAREDGDTWDEDSRGSGNRRRRN